MRRFIAPLLLALPLLVAPGSAHASVAPPTGRSDLRSFTGLGTWVDGYDFSRELTASPTVTARTVGFMAQRGVRTIYLQAAKQSPKTPYALLSRDRLGQILLAAHARGIRGSAGTCRRSTTLRPTGGTSTRCCSSRSTASTSTRSASTSRTSTWPP